MKRTLRTSHGIVPLLASAILGLSATTAHCQTGGRLGGPLAVFYGNQAAGYLTPYPAYINPALALTGADVAGNFGGLTLSAQQYVPYQSSAAGAYGSGAYAYSSQQGAGTGQQAATGSQASSTIRAQRTSSNQVLLQWSGDTSTVRRVFFAVFDKKDQVIAQKVITQAPVQARFALTDSVSYYGVQIEYANGATNTVYAPVR